MKRFIQKIGWTLLPLLFTGSVAMAQDAVKRPVVKITVQNEYGQEDDGTGVIVGQTETELFFVTAAHVISQPDHVKVRLFEGPAIQAEIVQANTSLDIAVIKCPIPNDYEVPASFAIAKEEEKVLQSVIVVGHPGGNNWDINFNTNVKATEFDLDDRLFTLAPIGITAGNSGGPVLSQAYELLGLVQSVDQVKAVCVNLATIMKACQAWQVPTNLLTGITIENLQADAGKEDFRYTLFLQEANSAFQAKKWELAMRAYEQANTLVPSSQLQAKVAQCELEISRDRLYQEYMTQGASASTLEASIGFFEQARAQRDSEEVRERIKFARERLAKLEVQAEELASTSADLPEHILDEWAGEMILVEGGTFMMGNDQEGFKENEFPPHRVLLSDYYIGAKEITVSQYCTYLNDLAEQFPFVDITFSFVSGISRNLTKRTKIRDYEDKKLISYEYVPNEGSGNYPVTYISWNEAMSFLLWLSDKTGYRYYLPTETQWEYAARGGQKSRNSLYAGSDNPEEVACFSWSDIGPWKTGTKQPNELGIYDMNGNVWEWCLDRYDKHYYKNCLEQGTVTDPRGPSEGEFMVIRGGSFDKEATVFNRDYFRYSDINADIGLRVVRAAYDPYAFVDPFEQDLHFVKGGSFVEENSTGQVQETVIDDFYTIPFPIYQSQLREIIGGGYISAYFSLFRKAQDDDNKDKNGYTKVEVAQLIQEQMLHILNRRTGKQYAIMTETEKQYIRQFDWVDIPEEYQDNEYSLNKYFKGVLFIKMIP